KVIQALVVSGNLEAGLMLLLAAVQEGFYNGTLEDFFENFGEHIFHSYMAVASLKTSGTVTGKVMGRSTAPKPKKARPTARATRPPTDVGREAREASQSSVKIAEGELLLTSEGKVSIILREGDNFVISFQDSRGLTRMPVDQLRKIVDAVPREKQEAFQRESREAKERDGAEDQRMVEEAGGELALEMASIPGAHSPELIAKIPSGISPNETVIYRGITSDTFVIDPSSKYTQHFTDNYQAAKKFAGEEGQVVAIAVDRGMLGERVSDRVGGTEHHGGFGNFEFSSKEISRLHKEGKVAVEKSIAIKEGSQRPTEIVEGELLLTPEETILVLSREGNDLIVQFQDGTLPFRMPVDILQRMVDAVPREKQKAFQREQQEAKARESGRSRTEIAPDVTRFEGGEKVLTSEGEVLIVSLRGGHFVVRFKNRGSVLIKATELQALIDAVPPAERAAFRQRQIESPTSNVDAPPQTILESSKTYLTKDGTVSILMRDGDVFVVTFNNGTGIQRIPPRELQKIVDAIPPEKQEAAQRESRETSERFMEEHERKVEEAGGVLAYEMQTSPGAHSRELIGRILEIAPNETVVYRGVKSDSYVVKPETGPHDRIQHFTDSYKAAKSFAGPEGQVVAIAIDQARLLDNHLSTRGGGFEDRSGALNFELSYENIYGLYQKGKIAAEKGLQVREPGQPPKKRIAPKPPTEVAQENASLDDHARLVEAQKYVVEKDLLDTEGTPTEHGKAVLAAHEVGLGKEGSYSLAEIGEKRGILGEAGFSKAEMRTLMEYGFVGEAGRLTGAASRRPIEEITRDFESAMRGDKLVLSKAGSDHVMEFEVRRFDSERGAFWVNHKGVNYRVTVEMNETGNYDVVLKGIKERRISQVGEVSIEKGEWRARLESEKRAEVMEAEAYLRYPGIIREKTRDLGGNEVHNELGEPVEGMVRVGTGTGALVPRGQEVMTSGVYSCMAVFVRGPKGNALIHLTPSGAGGTLTYSPRTLSKEIYPEIADKLWEIGEPNELEVTLLVNSESNHQYPVKKAEWETARRLFQREGIENVALVEMPFSEGTHLYYSPDNPGEIIAVGGEARVAETGMLTGARTVGVTTRRIRLGEDVRMERPALTSDQIAEAMRDIPGNNDFKRANLAEQIELSLESGGGANPENAILYGRVCNDLLDGMNHSYAEFGKRYDLYYDKGLRRSITEGMERESAGNMLLSDLFHSINGIVGMKSSFEAKKDMIRAQLEATVDSFGKYQQNPTEEAFYISQSAEGLIREFGRGQTVDSTLTGQDTVRAPHKMLQSILYNLYKNAASVSKQHGYNDSLEITYRGRRVGDNIIISIYDNLPGFKPEQLSSLFDGTVESTSEWGHGTGLHRIAKQAELVGGTIESYHLVQEGGREVWKRKAPGSPPETVPRPEGVPEGSTKFFVLKLPAEPIVVAQAEPSTNRGPLLED
ncbi:sensor histidine kinase, partial [Candidatus Peregrinibacteria bacterium]|nr:sensor histidine kinase [Candidatus Peregrinibacteria bacterium]